jgi:hypothetical protein
MRKWKRIKAGALAGFVQCCDKRLHHVFLSVLARDAFSKRKTAAVKGHNGAVKRWNQKGKPDATGNSTGNAPAIPATMAQASDDGWHRHPHAYSKGEESTSTTNTVGEPSRPVDKSRHPRFDNSTSTPKAAAHSTAKTAEQLAAQDRMREQAAPPPTGSPLEFYRHVTRKSETPEPTPPPQGAHEHGEESLDG